MSVAERNRRIEQAPYTKAQLEDLRENYAAIKTVNPDSPYYELLIVYLDSLTQAQLKQLAGSNIKWLSPLARNRVK